MTEEKKDIVQEEPYSFYDHLKANDIILALEDLLTRAGWRLRKVDGKLHIKDVQIARETPWIHQRHAPGFDCGLWHQVTFNFISSKLPEGQRFVPRHCQSCWKVVVKPRTLQQLFNLLEIEKRLDRPSKCGIEPRPSVPGLYGGYFYNKSIEEGLACYDIVKQALAENEWMAPLLDEVDDDGRTTRIILKRGCTEFEHLIGDSANWKITPEQNAIEDIVDRWVVSDNQELKQPENLIWNIKRRWIEFAWQNGDPTYALYTGGKPLYPAYRTYHQLKGEDDVCKIPE